MQNKRRHALTVRRAGARKRYAMGKYCGEIIYKGKVIALARWNSVSCFYSRTLLPPSSREAIYYDFEYRSCTCQQKPTRALAVCPEGGYTYAPIDICVPCRAIVDGASFDDVLCTEALCIKYGCSHFPRRGHPLELKEHAK